MFLQDQFFFCSKLEYQLEIIISVLYSAMKNRQSLRGQQIQNKSPQKNTGNSSKFKQKEKVESELNKSNFLPCIHRRIGNIKKTNAYSCHVQPDLQSIAQPNQSKAIPKGRNSKPSFEFSKQNMDCKVKRFGKVKPPMPFTALIQSQQNNQQETKSFKCPALGSRFSKQVNQGVSKSKQTKQIRQSIKKVNSQILPQNLNRQKLSNIKQKLKKITKNKKQLKCPSNDNKSNEKQNEERQSIAEQKMKLQQQFRINVLAVTQQKNQASQQNTLNIRIDQLLKQQQKSNLNNSYSIVVNMVTNRQNKSDQVQQQAVSLAKNHHLNKSSSVFQYAYQSVSKSQIRSNKSLSSCSRKSSHSNKSQKDKKKGERTKNSKYHQNINIATNPSIIQNLLKINSAVKIKNRSSESQLIHPPYIYEDKINSTRSSKKRKHRPNKSLQKCQIKQNRHIVFKSHPYLDQMARLGLSSQKKQLKSSKNLQQNKKQPSNVNSLTNSCLPPGEGKKYMKKYPIHHLNFQQKLANEKEKKSSAGSEDQMEI